MEFAVISPIAGLERYSNLSKTHLLLPQLSSLEGYDEFYHKMKDRGDFLIQDNGAYEGQKDWEPLLNAIEEFHPQVAVLPDYLLQHWQKTWRAASDFLDNNYYYYEDIKWMYVPQAEPGDIVGFIEGLFRALDDERISWIGLPRALTYAISSDLFMRVRVAEQIRKRSNVKIHALGMAKGSLEELNALNKIACVSSIDSNAPVWRGMCGFSMTDPWTEIPIDYSIKYMHQYHGLEGTKPCQEELILTNLEACGVNINSFRTRAASQRETTPRS